MSATPLSGRLPAKLEITALARRIEGEGGFATIVHRGDADGGALLLLITSRGRHFACLERILSLDGGYRWQPTGPDESADSQEVAAFLAKRLRFDPDLWAIELDIADPERFIAETTALG
ncbi:MAG: DUF1491 family protein [Sphingomicrobium sp.]